MTGRQNPVSWRPLGKTGVHYWLVQRMAKTCGVDTAQAMSDGDLQEATWVDMVQHCRTCQWVDGCQRWLDQQDTESAASPPGACVNGDIFQRLAERQKQ